MEEELVEQVADGIVWDKPFYKLDGQDFYPLIFDGSVNNLFSNHFNAVVISIDGRLKSDLDWSDARKKALAAIERGLKILWEIDLGLFSELVHPLSHQSQHLSLMLSLDHFKSTLWQEFKAHSLGLAIYRGLADFIYSFSWNDDQKENLRSWLFEIFNDQVSFENEVNLKIGIDKLEPVDLLKNSGGKSLLSLFCRNVAVEYMNLLTASLPDTLPRYVFLDAGSLAENHLLQARSLNLEVFDQINLVLKGHTIPLQALGWGSISPYGYVGHDEIESQKINMTSECSVGVCLPLANNYRPSQYKNLELALNRLIDKKIPIRIIAESQLITSWDGLDYLVYAPEALSVQGKRKLQGFCAAGGTVVTVSELQGFSQEVTFEVFVSK